jgi:hypothetical protein
VLDEILSEQWAVRSFSYYSCDEAEVVLSKPRPGGAGGMGLVKIVPSEPALPPADPDLIGDLTPDAPLFGKHTKRLAVGLGLFGLIAAVFAAIVMFKALVTVGAVLLAAYLIGAALLSGEQDDLATDYYPSDPFETLDY